MFLDRLRRRAVQAKFPNSDIAFHRLIPGGSVAGSLDNLSGSRISGWIFDATQPNRPSRARLIINGSQVADFTANIYREDIAALAGNNGLNGFEIDLDKFKDAEQPNMTIRIELTADSNCKLGPIFVVTDYSPPQPRNKRDARLAIGSLDDKLEHIFAHITVTFEENRQRLERLQSTVESIRVFARSSSGFDPTSTSNLSNFTGPPFSGIGVFYEGEIDESYAEDSMRQRIEAHLIKQIAALQ